MRELPTAPRPQRAPPRAVGPVRPDARPAGAVPLVPLVSLAFLLAACQPGLEAAGRKIDAPGVPVALVGVEGAPEVLEQQVKDEVVTQASARRIELVSGSENPRYRLRGYLTAYSTDNGETALAIVWDVFDAEKKRAQRVSTTTTARGQASDPWAQIGEAQIAKATSQSMNQVAAFLAATGPGGPAPLAAGQPAGAAVPAMALSDQ